MNTVPVRRNYLPISFNANNGLFYDHDNDFHRRRWVKVVLEDNNGETSVLTMSYSEMRILCSQFQAICNEHGWKDE